MDSEREVYVPASRAEAMTFYACENGRCRVRNWPTTAGDVCPVCNLSGSYAGIVVKVPDLPQQPEDTDERRT